MSNLAYAYNNNLSIVNPLDDQPCHGEWTRESGKYPSGDYYEYSDKAADEWPANKHPYTQSNLLVRQEEQVKNLIYRLKTPLSWSERLMKRLITLYHDAKESDVSSPGITLGSLLNFYNFLQSHADIKYPTISLTPEDNLYASWSTEKRLFSVHFLQNRETRFVIFKPNDKHPDRQVRISGTVTTDILKETVAPYGIWDWISE